MSPDNAEFAAAPLIRSRRAHPPAAALLLSGVLVAGCTGSSGHPATTAATRSAPSGANSSCLLPPASSCYAPHQFRVAYGIQPLLDSGIDGRGQTVTVLAPPEPPNIQGAQASTVPAAQSSSAPAAQPPGAGPVTTDIRKDTAVFDRMFRLPAARIQVVTTLAGSVSPWQASAEEVQDLQVVHTVAPAGDANQVGGLPVILVSGGQSAVNTAPGAYAATALWAGVMALAGQDAHHDLGFVDSAIYRIARGASYHKAFHDVTTGNNLTLGPVNYQYHAGPGWDPVTGWGSPDAQVLIPLLARR